MDYNQLENKGAVRFYEKDDKYELWFMDRFHPIGTNGSEYNTIPYTCLCDIIPYMLRADTRKELHIFIWSYGGACATLSMMLQAIGRFRRTVAINLRRS